LKKKIKQCFSRCKGEINNSASTKAEVGRILEQSRADEEGAFAALMETVVGEIQQEFLLTLRKETDRVAAFYQYLAKNMIREVNALLRDRDQWQ
jgi:hypothetical protein